MQVSTVLCDLRDYIIVCPFSCFNYVYRYMHISFYICTYIEYICLCKCSNTHKLHMYIYVYVHMYVRMENIEIFCVLVLKCFIFC